MITEIRIYKLKNGRAGEFGKLFTEQSLPMLRRWKVNVVDYGFSLIDPDSFYLVRGYDNTDQRKQSQDAFYGSEEWIKGPEQAIMDCIESYNTAVVDNNVLRIQKNEQACL
ncbi:MAG: NIPSNAP family protein [Sphingobacteriales bacterium]|nr:NIPSNAP family protein [Sphingobacteriales bacterium]